VPEGWQVYESLDGSFTIAYPGSWGIDEEGVQGVIFDIPGPLFLQVRLVEGAGDGFGENDEENVRIHTTQIAEAWSDQYGYTGFRIINKGVWKGNVYKGYFCEFIIYKEEFMEDDTPNIMRGTTILADNDAVVILYSHFMTTEFTADDRETFEAVLRTIRVK
jgi:hypothetical protein